MADGTVHMALFKEDQIDQAAEAITRLREMGITDNDISVISGVPLSEHILGRPVSWTTVPRVALIGAVLGFLAAVTFLVISQIFYPIRVGMMPPVPIPTSLVVVFELTMLGMLLSTFFGVFTESITPTHGPKGYDASISDGQIGILFTSPTNLDSDVHHRLSELGAEVVHRAEVKKLWP